METIQNSINILEQTIANKKKQVIDLQNNLCVRNDETALQNYKRIPSAKLYEYCICKVNPSSPYYIKTFIHLDDYRLYFQGNVQFDTYYDQDGNSFDLNSIRRQKYPEISTTILENMERLNKYQCILPNYTYKVAQNESVEFMASTKEYQTNDNWDGINIRLPITIPISFIE
jgi:hypothetical protein